MAINHQCSLKGLLVGRVVLYFSIVYVFCQVFRSVEATSIRIWYIAITEWIILSAPPIGMSIEQDIRSGQIAYFLLRPMHYLTMRLLEALGILAVRFILLGFCCIALGWCLTRSFPTDIIHWALGMGLGVMGLILYTLIVVLIGLGSFWLREVQAIIYLNLSATFCFGGLIIPLEYYSPWLQKLCFLTPYPWILWAPAQWMTGGVISGSDAVLGWSVWVFIIFSVMQILYRKCLKSLVVEGG